MANFFKTTIIGGLIFLIPIVVLSVILGKGLKIMMVVAEPLDKLIPIESVGGVALVNILTVLCLLAGCFFAGIAAKSKLGKTTFDMIDAKLLLFIPGYTYVKSMTSAFVDEEDSGKVLKPIVAILDDQSQLAFEVERTDDGQVVVFLPGTPDPRSGNVVYLNSDRVKPLDIEFGEVTRSLRIYGRGSGVMLPVGIPDNPGRAG